MEVGISDSFACSWDTFRSTGFVGPSLDVRVVPGLNYMSLCCVQLVPMEGLRMGSEGQRKWGRTWKSGGRGNCS